MQLEEELRLKKVEIEDLQAKVRGSNGTSSNGEVVHGQLDGQALQEAANRETGEEALASCRQEVDSLRATLDCKNQEISDLKQKVQQSTKENMDMMDTWKVKTKTTHSQSFFVADDVFQLVGAKYQTNQHFSMPFNLTKYKSSFGANFQYPKIVNLSISELIITWHQDLKRLAFTL